MNIKHKVIKSRQNNCGCNTLALLSHKNPQVGMISAAWFTEPTRALSLNTTGGLNSAPNLSCIDGNR